MLQIIEYNKIIISYHLGYIFVWSYNIVNDIYHIISINHINNQLTLKLNAPIFPSADQTLMNIYLKSDIPTY